MLSVYDLKLDMVEVVSSCCQIDGWERARGDPEAGRERSAKCAWARPAHGAWGESEERGSCVVVPVR